MGSFQAAVLDCARCMAWFFRRDFARESARWFCGNGFVKVETWKNGLRYRPPCVDANNSPQRNLFMVLFAVAEGLFHVGGEPAGLR
jgi:hypothetical protein